MLVRPSHRAALAGLASALLGPSLGVTVAAGAAAPSPRPVTSAHHPSTMHTSHIRLEDGSTYIGPKPCSKYYGWRTASDVPDGLGGPNPLAVCGYTPEQMRNAYGVADSGLRGDDVTVAIVGAYASPTMLADANQYSFNHDEPRLRPDQYREVIPAAYGHLTDGVCEAPADWAVEEALDVEAVHAMAPHANIVYVAAASCDDIALMAALQSVVTQRLATIVSASWGGIPHSVFGDEDPAVMAAYTALFRQGSAQGISFLFASGDCGASDPAAGCGAGSARPQTTYPAQDPWVTAVGGTSLGIGPEGRYLGVTGWGDERAVLAPDGSAWTPMPGQYRFGAGGGTSEDVPQPWYQQGKVPQALASTLLTGARSARPMRVLPDVAMDADPVTGFLTGLTETRPDGSTAYSESSIGGTSLATPLFAGMQADAQERVGHPQGLLNPALYALAGSRAFHDVTATSLSRWAPGPGSPLADVVDLGRDAAGVHQARLYRLGDDGPLAASLGYDDVTGIGSPNGVYLHSWG